MDGIANKYFAELWCQYLNLHALFQVLAKIHAMYRAIFKEFAFQCLLTAVLLLLSIHTFTSQVLGGLIFDSLENINSNACPTVWRLYSIQRCTVVIWIWYWKPYIKLEVANEGLKGTLIYDRAEFHCPG